MTNYRLEGALLETGAYVVANGRKIADMRLGSHAVRLSNRQPRVPELGDEVPVSCKERVAGCLSQWSVGAGTTHAYPTQFPRGVTKRQAMFGLEISVPHTPLTPITLDYLRNPNVVAVCAVPCRIAMSTSRSGKAWAACAQWATNMSNASSKRICFPLRSNDRLARVERNASQRYDATNGK